MGWDPSPRCDQRQTMDNSGYPFTSVIVGNTPEKFEAALRLTKERLLANPKGPRILNINCWNEWTEGSYLEPEQRTGMKYSKLFARSSAGNHEEAVTRWQHLTPTLLPP